MILVRYVTNKVIGSFIAITSILVLIALSNRLVTYLSKVTSGLVPLSTILKIVLLYIPDLLGFLIPLGFFMGILLSLGRLHVDSEMRVLSTSGLSSLFFIKIVITLSTIVGILNGFLTLWLVPMAANLREQALVQGEAIGVMQAVTPGQFQTLDSGRLVFYVADANRKENKLKKIFIAEQSNVLNSQALNWTIITAQEAKLKKNDNENNFYLILKNGFRYVGNPGSLDYTIVNFEEYGRSIMPTPGIIPNDIKLKQTRYLLNSNIIEDKAEFQWRLAFPITVFIFSLFGIVLSHVNPREGHFARFIPAILIYILYYNLLIIAKRYTISGVIHPAIGNSWVHIIMFTLSVGWLAKNSNGWNFIKRKIQ